MCGVATSYGLRAVQLSPSWRLKFPRQGSLVGKVTQGESGPDGDGSSSGKQLHVLSCHILGLLGSHPSLARAGAAAEPGEGKHKHQSISTPSCHEHLRMGSPISWSPLPPVNILAVLPSSSPCSSPSSAPGSLWQCSAADTVAGALRADVAGELPGWKLLIPRLVGVPGMTSL